MRNFFRWVFNTKVEPGQYRLALAKDCVCRVENSSDKNVEFRYWFKPDSYRIRGEWSSGTNIDTRREFNFVWEPMPEDERVPE